MKCIHPASGPRTGRPTLALRRSYATALLAWSALPLGAAASELAPADSQPRIGGPGHGDALPSRALQFDPDFVLTSPDGGIDLSRFEKGNPVWPGEYRADVYLNGALLGRDDVTVRESGANGPQVCFSRRMLDRINADTSRIAPEALASLADPAACESFDALLPGASASFDAGSARLDIHVPQALLRRTARGYVDPSMWDSGVTAGFVGYSANLYGNVANGRSDSAAYVGLNAGINAGGWYFRHDGALNWQNRGGQHYSITNTYVQRDLTALKARVRLGDANTSGELFDTFPFRGVQIANDDRMWPDSRRGYAPVVRGIANSNARVTVRQSGAVIYETTVPPGQFVIDDLYPTGYGGDLDVTVTESDGSERVFKVPYASVVQSLRPGMNRFGFVAGVVRKRNLSYTPRIVQATYARGVSNLLTLYGGVLANEDYQNLLVGGAFNTPIGAMALDVSGAFTSSNGRRARGASVRITYSKTLEATNSNLSVAAYRFSSSGYLDLDNALAYVDNARRNATGLAAQPLWRARNRVSVTASQRFGDNGGQLFVSAYTQNYWERRGTDTQFQIGYSNRFRVVDYSISVNRARAIGGDVDTQYMLTVSLPLGRSAQAPRASANVAHDSVRGVTSMMTASGFVGTRNQGSYSVSASRDAGATYSGSVSGQYRTPYTTVQGAFAKGDRYGSGSVGLSGSIVAHPGGVTASPYAADTVAVVAAPAAGGARVVGYGGVALDGRGYAVVPYLNPYRLNQIEIDPRGLPADVELQTTSLQVAPRQGAVVMLRYPTVKGRALLIHASTPTGRELPFGAPVFDARGNNVGVVSQGGQIYARIAEPDEKLTVKWGHADAWQCSIRVALPPLDAGARQVAIQRIDAPCEFDARPPGPGDAPRHAAPPA
ncbi:MULTISPECIES: fimbria/pilus outer membrane usher protein [Burkholderia]|uniref:fimbria/pilus outer membrane usher protein n=1 Tax=Burkholderia TaxID=32008 RepID=UPI00104BF377|nr:fimbria/pilus outer membrane usher protein [Burkholderia pyrrocinia]EKS9889266.1 fimbrial biogenesis outer membrane usher protein [Burkholderia pyrrocinia]EKS9896230.1 fimbrial biogenesis outer membrane usher protein [Burkholderia pyrrocinia]EKS9908267.1 fimbrial biogenesis outer membrane usher protein [Burkholderia pyrrocinia]TDA47506.1 fimbrial biogenesis outer membrane usher protein [Burkholderia pyrrocinia]